MKILHVTTSMDPRSGGPPQGLRNSIPALLDKGFENEVVCCDAPGADWQGQDVFPVHVVGPTRTPLRVAPKLGRWLDENLGRFDGVIIHGLWTWTSFCVTRAVARERRRRASAFAASGLRRDEGGDRGTGDGGRETGDGGSLSSQKSAIRHPKHLRCFVMPHGMLDPWFQRDKSRRLKAVRNWFYWWLVERNVVNSADAIFFTCDVELELARKTFRGYQPRQEINVTYGVADPPPFSPAMREAFATCCPDLGDRPYILFLSRIHPKKGVDLLVRAYARVRTEVTSEQTVAPVSSPANSPSTGGRETAATATRHSSPGWSPRRPISADSGSRHSLPDLVIAGPGWDSAYGREVRALVDDANKALAPTEGRTLNTEHSPACIHPVEMLSGAAKWGAIYGCEAFALPSHQENFGIVVPEALACGKPVLISNQVNIWHEIVDDNAGWTARDTQEGTTATLREYIRQRGRRPFGQGGAEDAPSANPHRACFLRRFAVGPASERLASVLRSFL